MVMIMITISTVLAVKITLQIIRLKLTNYPGRQSLSRLAANMSELQCVQIEITKAYGQSEWRDDLKQTMLKAGADNRGIVFLFSDAQVLFYLMIFYS
ncbi:unnamed protein product [Colias eurytheme]|nr:unnamed protein product [Colias eurytheme]